MEYFHLAGILLEPGSIILPGNWGRTVRFYAWAHTNAVREMALEAARVARFPHRPSRMDAAFAFPTLADLHAFRQRHQSTWLLAVAYRVSLLQPDQPTHIADSNWYIPPPPMRPDWADLYWMDEDDRAAKLSVSAGVSDPQAITGVIREVVTLSPLRIEERLL